MANIINRAFITILFTVEEAMGLATFLATVSLSPAFDRDLVTKIQTLVGAGETKVSITPEQAEELVSFFRTILPRITKGEADYRAYACQAISLILKEVGADLEETEARSLCICTG